MKTDTRETKAAEAALVAKYRPLGIAALVAAAMMVAHEGRSAAEAG